MLVFAGSHATNTGVVDIICSSTNPNAYAGVTDDAVLTALNARIHADLPYTRVSTSLLLAVNDDSAKEYDEYCYKGTTLSLTDVHIVAISCLRTRCQKKCTALVSSANFPASLHIKRQKSNQSTSHTFQLCLATLKRL